MWHEDHQRTYDDLNKCIGSESCLSYTTIHRRKRSWKLTPHIKVFYRTTNLSRLHRRHSHCTVSILEHITWDTGDREGCPKFAHVSLWQTIRHHNRPQTFARDTRQAAEECTSTSTTTPDQDTGIRLSARPGNQMIIADVFARLPNQENNAEIPLDVTVDDIVIDVDDDNACIIDKVYVSINKRVQLRDMSTSEFWPHTARSTTISKGSPSLLVIPRWNRHFRWHHLQRETVHHTRCNEKWHPAPTTWSWLRNWENKTTRARVCVLATHL